MRVERAGIVAALVAALMAGQASAANQCWSAQEVSAAKVRNLQSMLMVASLRCHGSGVEVLANYNAFVSTNRAALVQANKSLKAYFTRTNGTAEGLRRYDRFTTALANAYGAGAPGGASCSDMAMLARDAEAARGSLATLIQIAERRAPQPVLPGTSCAIAIAAK